MSGRALETIDRRAWLALALASSTSLTVGLAVTAVNIAFPAIEHDFAGASRSTLSWGLTGYSITLASLLLMGGRLADQFGRRRVFRIGTAVFTLSSVALALAPTPWAFVAGRLGQAVGAAFASPASLTLVLARFPVSRRTTVVGTWTAVGTMGAAIGPSLSAVVTQGLGWRWIFVVPLPVCVAVWALAPRLLPEGAPEPGVLPVDVWGVLQGSAGVGLVAAAITEGPALGWTHPFVLGAAVGAAVLLPTFVRRSLRHRAPLLDVRLFTLRTVWSANAAIVMLTAAGNATWLAYPLFLVQRWHYSLLRAGIAMTPFPLTASLTGLTAGRLVEHYGIRRVVAVGSVAPLAGLGWLAWHLGPDPHYARDLLPGGILFNLGWGLVYPPVTAAALRGVPHGQLGQATAAFSALRQLAGGLGIAAVIAVLGNADVIPLQAFDQAFLACAVMTLGAWFAIAFGYPRDALAAIRPVLTPAPTEPA